MLNNSLTISSNVVNLPVNPLTLYLNSPKNYKHDPLQALPDDLMVFDENKNYNVNFKNEMREFIEKQLMITTSMREVVITINNKAPMLSKAYPLIFTFFQNNMSNAEIICGDKRYVSFMDTSRINFRRVKEIPMDKTKPDLYYESIFR